ncbi:hypothetical protein BPUN_0066 [Candidatus Paraburkholderia kirkii]|nr:hypothetical protein BPUN_0066 [Candidatus Paraburkholderia kirkii]
MPVIEASIKRGITSSRDESHAGAAGIARWACAHAAFVSKNGTALAKKQAGTRTVLDLLRLTHSGRTITQRTLVIKDLPIGPAQLDETSLTQAQMRRIAGGRAVLATVDGRGSATIDDFDINTAIFEDRIVGTQREN